MERPNPIVGVSSYGRELGRTEPQFGTNDPVFTTPIVVNREEAKITFTVYDTGDRKVGLAKDVSLADIMAGQEWRAHLVDDKKGYRLSSGQIVVRWAMVV